MSYKVVLPKKKRPDFGANRQPPRGEQENLSGTVQGQNASDIEERFAIALMKRKIDFQFQYVVYTAVTVPGNANVVDFLVDHNGVWLAFEIDGQIGHMTTTQKNDDVLRDVLVNDALMRIGVGPITRIPWTKLETQELADRTLAEVLRV